MGAHTSHMCWRATHIWEHASCPSPRLQLPFRVLTLAMLEREAILQVWACPPQGHPCSPSPWLVASLAPLFLLSGLPRGFLPIRLLSWHRTPASPPATPRNLQASTLIWAEAMATSQGSEGSGPKEPHVTFRSFVSGSGSWPRPTPSDAEPRPQLPVPSCPGSHLLPLLSESGLGLSAWARRSCFGLLRSIQASGPQPQCPWPSPAGLPHARSCPYLSLCLAWLSPLGEPLRKPPKHTQPPVRDPGPLCICHLLPFFVFALPSGVFCQLPPLHSVRADGQCRALLGTESWACSEPQ